MSDAREWAAAAALVLQHYGMDGATCTPATQGLINLTLKVTAADGRRYALQRLHPVFGPGVNRNLERITAHLAGLGMLTPRLVRTRDDAIEVPQADGVWRLLTWIAGRTFDALHSNCEATAAGRLLGRFHAALARFDGVVDVDRAPVHDLDRHLGVLGAACDEHRGHRLATPVAALADIVRAQAGELPAFARQPERLVHGDPKISNVLFDDSGREALCLIDLDTLARMPVAYELGDAMRSWCNPEREDAATARFDVTRLEAAVRGYHAGVNGLLGAAEYAAIVPGTMAIHLELAARFLADALAERYFSWDSRRYPAPGEHNLARARGQLAALASLSRQRDVAEAAVERAVNPAAPTKAP